MSAKFVPAVPEETKTVVVVPGVKAKVQIEVSVEGAAWLLAFAGLHNGDEVSNPVSGLYRDLCAVPEVSGINQRAAQDRLQRVLKLFVQNTNAGRYACMAVNSVR